MENSSSYSANKLQSESVQACVDNCLKTYEVCTRTLAAGLEINEDQDFITALQLCGQACQLTAQALLLDSEFYSKACELCASFCEEVADLCEDFDEAEMKNCGQICLKCAKSCRVLLSMSEDSHLSRQSDGPHV